MIDLKTWMNVYFWTRDKVVTELNLHLRYELFHCMQRLSFKDNECRTSYQVERLYLLLEEYLVDL